MPGFIFGQSLQSIHGNETEAPGDSRFLIFTGVFAWLWVLARGCVQSITIDEADTYLTYASRHYPSHWDPSANNHVLNSLLMRLFTSIFGASHLTIRLPALIGASIYIIALYFLIRLMTGSLILRWSLYACLIFSPFVMDYLVAARGYSLALGFLVLAILLVASHLKSGSQERAASLNRTVALASASLALSFCANFSFALADAAVGLLLLSWICRNKPASHAKTVATFVWPGLLIACFLVGTVVAAFPRDQLTWGATSLSQTFRSLLKASVYEPNPYLLNPLLHKWFVMIGPRLFLGFVLAFVLRLITLIFGHAAIRDKTSRWHTSLMVVCLAALALTLGCHQILHSAFKILLPLSRTALFVAPLCFLMAGSAAAIPLHFKIGRASGAVMTAALALVACYSLGCLRLNYFKEWKWDADMKRVYSVVAYYNHTYGVTAVSADWRYVAALNCYRDLSGRETLQEVAPGPDGDRFPRDFPVYVLYYPDDESVLHYEKLKIVYHEDFTGTTVAIRPEIESTLSLRRSREPLSYGSR